MSNAALDLAQTNLELAWSLWTEMGIPGVVRNHRGVAIDPEPLILWSSAVVLGDPRLRDLVYAWCKTNADRVSASRLRGLLTSFPKGTRTSFGALATALPSVRWPASEEQLWPIAHASSTPKIPMQRASMLRFRARGLCGVGARADVVCALLAAFPLWTSAFDLAEEGYSKRNVARILSELHQANLVAAQTRGNRISFRLCVSEPLTTVLGSEGVAIPPWRELLRLMSMLTELAARNRDTNGVRRVAAHKMAIEATEICKHTGLEPPPNTVGERDAFEMVMQWAQRQAALIATGTATVFRTERTAEFRYPAKKTI